MERVCLRRVRAAAAIATVIAGLSVSCGPRVGASCKVESRESCVDDKHALACVSGKWATMDCKGAEGCKGKGAQAACDQSVAAIGDTCSVNENHTCGDGAKMALACHKGKWERASTCAGARGCVVSGRNVDCDNSIARTGDPCTVEGDVACSDSKKATLVCRNSVFEQRLACRGAAGCAVNNSMQVVCDDSLAEVDDVCEHADHFSCASDGKSVLRCDGRKFMRHQECRPKTTCKVQTEGVTCATSG